MQAAQQRYWIHGCQGGKNDKNSNDEKKKQKLKWCPVVGVGGGVGGGVVVC